MRSDTHLELVTCSIDMCFGPGDLDQAIQLLVSTVGRVKAKAGCKECLVARDAAEDAKVHYEETWESEHAFRRHLKSEEFLRVLVAMDLCREEPRVTIGHLSGRAGMACLQEWRESQSEDYIEERRSKHGR